MNRAMKAVHVDQERTPHWRCLTCMKDCALVEDRLQPQWKFSRCCSGAYYRVDDPRNYPITFTAPVLLSDALIEALRNTLNGNLGEDDFAELQAHYDAVVALRGQQ